MPRAAPSGDSGARGGVCALVRHWIPSGTGVAALCRDGGIANSGAAGIGGEPLAGVFVFNADRRGRQRAHCEYPPGRFAAVAHHHSSACARVDLR